MKYTLENEEVIEFYTEEDFLQFINQLCWDVFKWTPLLEISESIVFVHSETWHKDFYSKEGAKEWLQKGINIENEPDEMFFEQLIRLLKITIL